MIATVDVIVIAACLTCSFVIFRFLVGNCISSQRFKLIYDYEDFRHTHRRTNRDTTTALLLPISDVH